MITPILEKLILSGKAQFKTFMVGGSAKHILNVSNDRFIIITDIQYFHTFNAPDNYQVINANKLFQYFRELQISQVKIFSEKSQNVFSFRNSYNVNLVGQSYMVEPFGSTKVDTFLIHESDVSFSFSYGTQFKEVLKANTPADSIAFQPPYDYGKGNLPTTIDVRLVGEYNTGTGAFFKPGGTSSSLNNYNGTLEISYPIEEDITEWVGVEDTDKYPLMIVQYVEIPGNPTNILKTM